MQRILFAANPYDVKPLIGEGDTYAVAEIESSISRIFTLVTVSTVNEELLRKKRYQETCPVYSVGSRFSVSSCSAHKNLRVGIQNGRSGG